MEENAWLAEQFEENRDHLLSVAYRMLGSRSEAEDAVQEAWLRLSRSDTSEVENIGGWQTTIVARICLNMLRSRKTRQEESLEEFTAEPVVRLRSVNDHDPEREALLADSMGPALLVVLETLNPSERLAFVLHDMFGVSFEEIAPIVGRTAAAARQLASRARRRVQGIDEIPDADIPRQREIVNAFLTASRGGDFEALLTLLDPNVVVRADSAAVQAGALAEVFGASEVAKTFAGRAKAAQPALIDGYVGLVWARGGIPQVIFDLTIEDGKIVEIELLADADRLSHIDLEILDEG